MSDRAAIAAEAFLLNRHASHRNRLIPLRLVIVTAMALALAGGLATALTLLPPELHTTATRIWVGVALFGITLACLTAIAAYVTYEARWTRRDSLRMLSEIPAWTLELLPPEERDRYEQEFNAHLFELVESGEYAQAERDRRALMRASLSLSIVVRMRRPERAH